MVKNIRNNVKYMDSAGKAHDTEIGRDAQNLRGSSLSVLEKIAPSETRQPQKFRRMQVSAEI